MLAIGKEQQKVFIQIGQDRQQILQRLENLRQEGMSFPDISLKGRESLRKKVPPDVVPSGFSLTAKEIQPVSQGETTFTEVTATLQGDPRPIIFSTADLLFQGITASFSPERCTPSSKKGEFPRTGGRDIERTCTTELILTTTQETPAKNSSHSLIN